MEPIAHGTKRTVDLCCWPDCYEPVENPDVPLCEQHFRDVGMRWLRENIDVVRAAVREVPAEQVVLDDARRRLAQRVPEEPRIELLRDQGVVYYIRVRGSERVKIGTTTNLRDRMVALRADQSDLMATEPGGYATESRRHREFAEERYGRREEFALSDRLTAHIASLVSTLTEVVNQ